MFRQVKSSACLLWLGALRMAELKNGIGFPRINLMMAVFQLLLVLVMMPGILIASRLDTRAHVQRLDLGGEIAFGVLWIFLIGLLFYFGRQARR